MKIKPENYITVQGWMRTELGLKGNDLIVYAIIYGFSQEDGQQFTGSLQYLADWCGATKQGILKNLKNLQDLGLIEKQETSNNELCYYTTKFNGDTTKFNGGLNLVKRGIKLSLTNNIDNNKIENKDIKNINFKLGTKTEKPTTSLYSKCLAHIHNFSSSLSVQQCLKTFLDSLVEMHKLRGEKQFIGILDKLASYADNAEQQIKIIRYSIEHGYGTFYELKDNGYSKPVSTDTGRHSQVATEKQKEELRRQIENGTAEEF